MLPKLILRELTKWAARSQLSRPNTSKAKSRTRAYRWQKQIDAHERVIVGVNSYQMEEHSHPKILLADPALQTEQIRRLEALTSRT